MNKKICFLCGVEKNIKEFYKHPGMSDKHLGKCKICCKNETRKNYIKNIEYYKEYDKKRGNIRNIKKNKPLKPKKKYKDIIYKTWNGNKNEYRKIHYWVESKLGRPKKCSICKTTFGNPRRFHWANKSGEYKMDIKDWVRLCAHCHFLKDNKNNKIKQNICNQIHKK